VRSGVDHGWPIEPLSLRCTRWTPVIPLVTVPVVYPLSIICIAYSFSIRIIISARYAKCRKIHALIDERLLYVLAGEHTVITEPLKQHKLVTVVMFASIGALVGGWFDAVAVSTMMGLLLGITFVYGERRV
jgi:hypothetical protein